MSERDRLWTRAYNRAYHDATRPLIRPEPQAGRGDLPPIGVLATAYDGSQVQCHACGRWFRTLMKHVPRHGLSVADYKERYGLAAGIGLCAPAYSAANRERALARDFGGVGRAVLRELPSPPHALGPQRLSTRLKKSARHNRERDAVAQPPPTGFGSGRRGRQKLTSDQVAGIRALQGQATARDVAARYQVDRRHVARIWAGIAWRRT